MDQKASRCWHECCDAIRVAKGSEWYVTGGGGDGGLGDADPSIACSGEKQGKAGTNQDCLQIQQGGRRVPPMDTKGLKGGGRHQCCP